MKVAIIGAGPAGLSTAIELSKAKYEVFVFEQFLVGENIVCAEGFFDYFGKIDVDLPEKIQIKKLIVQDKETYEISLPTRGRFFTFDRKRWQKNLADCALSKGAKIEEKSKIEKKDLERLVKEFDYVIDATGVRGVSHHQFPQNEIKTYRKNLMPSIQYKLKGDFSKFYETIKVILINNPPGYCWIFPRKEGAIINKANIGLGLLAKKTKNPNLKNLLKEMIKNEGFNISDEKSTASPIPTRRIKTYKAGNIILSGDSLGLCSPLHGGGIDTAYLSGYYIAKSIINNDFFNYESFLKNIDRRFFIERVFLVLWDKLGSHKILCRLKNKGLFSEKNNNVPLTKEWFLKALIRLVF
ncbi:MAG: NAD(P)/FAD-dependent oxidoreductase [Proteobacteria bacterium]|nr:NAD(P)/FAD-dependent oxidoreductase [Pseudomonadota bacterium]